MTTTTKIAAIATAAATMGTMMLSGPAFAQSSQQKNKNNMRNIGIVAGVLAGHELLHGKTRNGLLLGAGALYAGKKYEDARKAQHHHRY
jgi:hypothetical protein